MQYVLSEEEYKEFSSRVRLSDYQKTVDKLQKVCVLAANHVPCHRYWDEDNKSPWGCNLKDGVKGGYCDDCPVAEECPYPNKHWSK